MQMMQIKIKICGLKVPDDVKMCTRYGVDVLGFVVDYPKPVPWSISTDTAKKLVQSAGLNVETCIVTGGDTNKVLAAALDIMPDFVQLHTRETIRETEHIAHTLSKRSIKTIKTVYPDMSDDDMLDYIQTGIYALLLDPRIPEMPESRTAADLSRFISLRSKTDCPLILAGGINAGNAVQYIQEANPWMIDVMTGVESSPGVKDELKVKALMESVNAAP